LLHVSTAVADSANRVGEAERPRGHLSGVFAKAVSGDECRLNPLFVQHAPGSNGNRENRGLSILRQTQLVFGTFKAKLRQFHSQSFIGLYEGLSRDRKAVGKIFAHTDGLRTLAGKEKGK